MSGYAFLGRGWGRPVSAEGLYAAFKDPGMDCRPFVRWWWTGEKIEQGELARFPQERRIWVFLPSIG